MEIKLIITFHARPEKRLAFGALLEQVKQTLPRVKGCKGVRVFNSAADPCVFTLLETWESEEQHRAHIEQVRSSGTWANIATHLAAEPVSGYYREL